MIKNSNGIKVLTIGTDRSLFNPESAVSRRVIEYGQKMGELHIVVFATSHMSQVTCHKLGGNVWVYPTNSISRWMYVPDAIRLGKKIIGNWKLEIENSRNVVVSSQDPFECGFVGWRIARAYHLPLHLQVHTDFLSPYFITSTLQRIRVLLARWLLPRATGIRVVSQRIADSLRDSGIQLRARVQVLPIRVDMEALQATPVSSGLKSRLPGCTFIILMASRLSKEKRIDDALSIMSHLVADHPYVGLAIAGDGPEKLRLKHMARRLGLERHVLFLGQQKMVFGLMKSAQCFLSTSEYEGYGMSIVEAGLAHLPVVATDVGIAGEVLVNRVNAYVCPVGDTLCMVSHIRTLISHNTERMLIADRLYTDVSAHIPSYDTYVAEYVKGIEDTVKNSGIVE